MAYTHQEYLEAMIFEGWTRQQAEEMLNYYEKIGALSELDYNVRKHKEHLDRVANDTDVYVAVIDSAGKLRSASIYSDKEYADSAIRQLRASYSKCPGYKVRRMDYPNFYKLLEERRNNHENRYNF